MTEYLSLPGASEKPATAAAAVTGRIFLLNTPRYHGPGIVA